MIARFLFREKIEIFFGLLAVFCTMIANRSGVGWSWDTSDYVAVGKNFADGRGLLDATGIPMTVRPPGLSVLLAIGDWLGLSANSSALVLNVLCASIVVVATNHLLRLADVRESTRLIATSLIALSPALYWQYSMIWSEPPFIAILAISIIFGLRQPSASKYLVLFALFVSLFFIRYVGPVFAFAITLVSTLVDRKLFGALKATIVNLVTFLLSLLPVWLWLQRNENLDGTLTGARAPGGGNIIGPLKTFAATLGSWVVASPVEGGIYLSWSDYPANTKIFGTIFVLVFLALATGYLVLRLRTSGFDSISPVFVIGLAISFVYVGFSAYRFVYFELGPLDNRMMIPIYMSIVICCAIALDGLRPRSSVAKRILTSVFVIFVLFQGVATASDINQFGRDGRYWAAKDFVDLPIHRFVASLPLDSSLMSNQPQQLFSIWRKSSVFNQYQLDLAQKESCSRRLFVWYDSKYDDGTTNLEGQPENAPIVYSDEMSTVFDLGQCASNINFYWP